MVSLRAMTMASIFFAIFFSTLPFGTMFLLICADWVLTRMERQIND